MKKFGFIAAILFSLYSMPSFAQSGEPIGQLPVDDSFIDIGPRWEQGQSIHLWVTVVEHQGRFAVCAITQNVRNNRDRQVMSAISLTVNQTRIQNGFRWAPNVTGNSRPDGRPAECRLTPMAVVDDPVFDVEISRTRY
ncbi:hypothetical protein EU803_11855 [Loktanella sp. IMCC34160]|uniref:hypothetical protein n=1 Tax=Loktanella sp. IMCC34160 TaxID=2510646 RepID=UPI00101CAC1C|nr:hypothetical protein [Loktanella sp. IMCC34160]RYG90689.1 hypothetical protein EU803_11855 [Loktanella sp. IMCC34160]